MSKQQTAVEWLSNQVYELFEQYSEGKFDRIQLNKFMVDATNQAKLKHIGDLNEMILDNLAEEDDELQFIKKQLENIEHYKLGYNVAQRTLYTEEEIIRAMEFARGHHKMTDTQFLETLKNKL